jgi:hypothetical protein
MIDAEVLATVHILKHTVCSKSIRANSIHHGGSNFKYTIRNTNGWILAKGYFIGLLTDEVIAFK